MAPIKMKDGQFAYPITAVGELAKYRRLGWKVQYNTKTNNPAYENPINLGGWLDDPSEWAAGVYIKSGKFLLRAVVPAKPGIWQRVKGWFA